jgi:hypothetical protein
VHTVGKAASTLRMRKTRTYNMRRHIAMGIKISRMPISSRWTSIKTSERQTITIKTRIPTLLCRQPSPR